MRTLFVWEAPDAQPEPAPLTMREATLLVDVGLGVWAGVPPESPLGREIAAAQAHRTVLDNWQPPPFVPLPAIAIDGRRGGLAWGRAEVDSGTRHVRMPMTTEPLSIAGPMPIEVRFDLALFSAHAFRDDRGTVTIFVRDGIDIGRVAARILTLRVDLRDEQA